MSSIRHSLSPLREDDFVRLAQRAGLEINEDDLRQMRRRHLIEAVSDEDPSEYSAAHLYVVALYLDAIRVERHPWGARSSSRSLDDVRNVARVITAAVRSDHQEPVDAELLSDVATLLLQMERYLNTLDPFGPIAGVIDLIRPDVILQLQGDGRLYAELRSTAACLAELLEGMAEDVDAEPNTGPIEADIEIPVEEARTTTEATAVERNAVPMRASSPSPEPEIADATPSEVEDIKTPLAKPVHTSPGLPPISAAKAPSEVSVASEVSEISEPATIPVDSAAELPPTIQRPAISTTPPAAAKPPAPEPPATVSEVKTGPPTESGPPAPAKAPSGAPTVTSPRTSPLSTQPAAPPTALKGPPTESAAPPVHAAPPAPASSVPAKPATVDDSDEFASELTAQIQVPKPNEHPTRFDNERPQTGRTRDLMSRLEELRSRDKAAALDRQNVREDDGELAVQIDELNQLREQHLAAQDWDALASLYVDRIDLFEDPPERQQIHLALATIYESKLDQPTQSLERFLRAFESEGPGRAKALKGARRVAEASSLQNAFGSWVVDFLDGDVSPSDAVTLQPDLARALFARGERQRAFLTLASFLADSPEDRVDAESLESLETMATGLPDEELDGFFSDLVEQTTSPEVIETVGIRAALSHMSRNQSHHAIRYLRRVLEVSPDNQVAYSNLSRLYEAEENWPDLKRLVEDQLSEAHDDEARIRLEKDQKRVAELSESHADPEAALDEDPDDPAALREAMAKFTKDGAFTDAYGLLNRLIDRVKSPEQRVRVLVHLANIATEHLHAPEEAEHHINEALDASGTNAHVLGALARMHAANGNWMNTVSTVESILASSNDDVTADEKIGWLELGIDAASKAHRGEERMKFLDEIRQLDPSHPLVNTP